MQKKIEIRISGLGGQGVVLAGQVLGKAAVYSGKNTVQTQSYGAEARGSAAKSDVIISEGKIGFPAVRKCDVIIVMSQQALAQHVKDVRRDGVLLIENTAAKSVSRVKAKIFRIPAIEKSKEKFGKALYANMVMLGALVKMMKLVNDEAMEKAIKDSFSRKAAMVNIKAYRLGKKLIGDYEVLS